MLTLLGSLVDLLGTVYSIYVCVYCMYKSDLDEKSWAKDIVLSLLPTTVFFLFFIFFFLP